MSSISQLKGLARTCLGPLYARAYETLRPVGILRDPKSVELHNQIEFDTTDINWPFYQLQITIRTEIIDEITLNFMSRYPEGFVVNLGAGLDTRFHRLSNGRIRWYEIDFPEVIELRRQFFTENQYYCFISASLPDLKWIDRINTDQPILFILEGLVNYLKENEIRTLFRSLVSTFPKSEIVMEALGWLYIKLIKSTEYKWGMSADSHPIKWDPRLEIVNSLCMFDRHPERWEQFRWLGPLMAFRKNVEVIFHLRVNQ
jgi:O-methyltransferase involved in polyketide biosynthesis